MRLLRGKNKELFLLFKESAWVVVRGGNILQNVVNDYRDLDIKMAELTAMEYEGDNIIQELVRRLNNNCQLPFDHEDALRLVQKLAAILDYIAGIVDRMILYKTGEPDQRVKDMTEVLCKSLSLQEKAMNLLNSVKRNKKEILAACEEINKLERRQDDLYRTGLACLFDHENDPIAIIKWREIYEHIEMAEDYVNDVARLISNICVKYS